MAHALTTNGDRATVPAEPHARPKSLGDFVKALWQERSGYLADRYQAKAAMTSTGGLTGGYLVPVEFARTVLATAQEESFFLQNGFRVPLTSSETLVAHVAVNAGAAGKTPFFGGVQFVWGSEGVDLSQTEPTFTQAALRSHPLQGYAVISNQLLQDAEDNELSGYLTQLLGQAAAWYFDYACFSGDGVGKPHGVIHAPGRLLVTGGALTTARVSEMASKLLPGSWGTAVWAMHPNAFQDLGDETTYILNPQTVGGLSLMGRPVILTEKLSASGLGNAVLFDPRLYLVGIRQEVEVSISRDQPTLYLKNQSVIRMVCRGDGVPRLPTSVVLADGTETASAYVVSTT